MGRNSKETYYSCRSVPLLTLAVRGKKTNSAPQIECAPFTIEIIPIHTTRLTPNVYVELKKDPGVPRLPNLKVRSAELQRRRSVCTFHPFRPHN